MYDVTAYPYSKPAHTVKTYDDRVIRVFMAGFHDLRFLKMSCKILKTEHHVSLADAVVAAFALQHHAILIHKDPEFEALAGFLPMEALPYSGPVKGRDAAVRGDPQGKGCRGGRE